MVGSRVFRRKQKKNEIHRLIVGRAEIHRMVEARKKPDDLLQPGNFPMGDRDAMAHARRSQLFALGQGLVNAALGKTRKSGGMFGQLLKSLFLARNLQM